MAKLDALKDLYIFQTDTTIEAVRELKRLRPGCRIDFRSDRDPE